MKKCRKCQKKKSKSEFREVHHQDGSWDYQAWCKECHKKYQREHPRKVNLDKVFGEGATKYRKKKFNEQDGLCAICGKPEGELNRKMSLDHNHETGEWRGLLCTGCNLKLGWVEKHLYKVLKYLEEYK